MRRFIFLFIFSTLLVIPSVVKVEAVTLQGLDQTASTAGIKNSSPADVNAVAGKVLNQVLSLVGILFFCLILYAGVLWMTAAGDTKKIDLAKSIIISAVIGLIIVAGAYAITNFVGESISGNPNI